MLLQVHYVDHGFSEVISKTKAFELHEKFFQLPFQASKCKLAGERRHRNGFSPTPGFLTAFLSASRLGAVLSGTQSAEEI